MDTRCENLKGQTHPGYQAHTDRLWHDRDSNDDMLVDAMAAGTTALDAETSVLGN
jgi:hypothetical protein